MLKKTFLAATAAVSFAMAGGASAATLITFVEGGGNLAPGETDYANFDTTFGDITGGAIVNGDLSGQYAEPAFGDQGDDYLNVLGGTTASLDFTSLAGGGVASVGLDYGSADNYNFFELLFSDGGSETYSGQDVINIGDIANGDQVAPPTNGRLTFTADPGRVITGLNLSSTQNSLESDNYGVRSAVPEPSTWAMLLFGFGGIGFAMRRRKSDNRGQRVRIAYS